MSNPIFPQLGGLQIYTNPYCFTRTQVRFPKTKKKRIQRKWAKDQRYYENVPWDHALRVGNMLICHPDMALKIRAAFATQHPLFK